MKKLLVALILIGAIGVGIYGINTSYIRTKALGYGQQVSPFAVTTNESGQTVFRVYDYMIDFNGLFNK